MNIKTNIIRVCALLIGVVMCAFGVYRGEQTDMMRKAVVVCFECIGIG